MLPACLTNHDSACCKSVTFCSNPCLTCQCMLQMQCHCCSSTANWLQSLATHNSTLTESYTRLLASPAERATRIPWQDLSWFFQHAQQEHASSCQPAVQPACSSAPLKASLESLSGRKHSSHTFKLHHSKPLHTPSYTASLAGSAVCFKGPGGNTTATTLPRLLPPAPQAPWAQRV